MLKYVIILFAVVIAPLADTCASDGNADVAGAFHLSLADAALADVAAPSTAPFAKGSWTWQVYGSATFGFDHGDIYLAHAGVGYYMQDNFSVNLEAIGGYTNNHSGEPDAGSTFGLDLLLRWHFVNANGYSVYIDGGAGMIWFNDNFPSAGTHQNFTPQIGIGFTARLADQLRLMAGVRWHHVSNAGKSGVDRNPGHDGIMVYAGLMMPF